MGIKNEEVLKIVKYDFLGMENHFNIMEKELTKDTDEDFNRAKVAMSFGKLTKLYENVAYLMGIYDNNPKYEGR